MRLLNVFVQLLTQFSVGVLLLSSLLQSRTIRVSFFTFNSLLSALAAMLALTISKWMLEATWWEIRYLGLTVILAVSAFGAYRLDRPEAGRVLMILAGVLGLVFGVLPGGRGALALAGYHPKAAVFFDLGAIAGTLLLGATTVSMILGHWYLIMRRLSFEHLERFVLILLGSIVFRGAVLFATVTMLRAYDPDSAARLFPTLLGSGANLMFFVLRAGLGVVLPVALALMALQCVKQKANQAATGLLYVVQISVLFGELFAAYLLV